MEINSEWRTHVNDMEQILRWSCLKKFSDFWLNRFYIFVFLRFGQKSSKCDFVLNNDWIYSAKRHTIIMIKNLKIETEIFILW